ncbi:DUF4291 domain-containing protein [Rubripirellula reticaptiva]|uniref:DUF4291 domain-containing protein n=1 Tax=Rubripirellula reticaptiva TaxID=2528013 RepID=A0A5C6ELD6_9BACT|nr:DUF4291 domain-containing protein [Rubripirellula reticaptiva]TWU49275.1 hypothetical protein Poly59_38890 [Rubripirellula reticaptiva]
MNDQGKLRIDTASYSEQVLRWPESGRHILAQHDDDTILVYQAYRPAIGLFAAQHGYFGGDFKYTRMSWIKPNFLWMMYRSDWGRSEGQEVILAIRLRRTFFDSLLQQTVPSSFTSALYSDHDEWKAAVGRSNVRLQWDPDHTPTGHKCERRAIQLGLRGETLEAYGKHEALEIINVSDFVAEQREHIGSWKSGTLVTPAERVYVPADCNIADHLGLNVQS